MYVCCLFFFFSSRRRHTRSKRDWSSDVCSSDLSLPATTVTPGGRKAKYTVFSVGAGRDLRVPPPLEHLLDRAIRHASAGRSVGDAGRSHIAPRADFLLRRAVLAELVDVGTG